MEELIRLREAKGLSQGELARRAGMHRSNLSRIEGGYVTPSLPTLERLVEALDAEMGDLFPKAQAPLFEPSNAASEAERGTFVVADAVVAAAERWLEEVQNLQIPAERRFGIRDAAILIFDEVNRHGYEEWKHASTERRVEIAREIGDALTALHEIPIAAYEADPEGTHAQNVERRRKQMVVWTRRLGA